MDFTFARNSNSFQKERKSISTSIMDELTDKLLSGELKPGDKLPTEIEFAQQLGVGRGSIREAIKMLSSIGVVEIRRGEGTFIAEELSPSMINPLLLSLIFEQRSSMELIELRILLEAGAVQLIIDRVNDDDIQKLTDANELLLKEAQKENPDPQVLLDLDMNFHMLLNELSQNRMLTKIYQTISSLFFSSVRKSIKHDPLSAYNNHKMIIDAIKAKDHQRVQEIIRKSLSSWMKFID